MDEDFRILLKGHFNSHSSGWDEYLCLERNGDRWILTRRGYEVLAPLSDFEIRDEDGEFVEHRVPDEIDGQTVAGIEGGEYVIGGSLVPHDGDSELTLDPGDLELARSWLQQHEWHYQPGFEEAWGEIVRTAGRT